MNKREKNSFEELEKYKLDKHGSIPDVVQDNIDRNISVFKVIGETIELYTGKFIKTFLKMNG